MTISLIIQIIQIAFTVLGLCVILGMYFTKVKRNETDIAKTGHSILRVT